MTTVGPRPHYRVMEVTPRLVNRCLIHIFYRRYGNYELFNLKAVPGPARASSSVFHLAGRSRGPTKDAAPWMFVSSRDERGLRPVERRLQMAGRRAAATASSPS